MVLSRSIKEQMLKYCGSICEDDGSAAQIFKKSEKKKNSQDNVRQLRLCRQVERALGLAMSACPAVALRPVQIKRVVPGDNSSYLYVEIDLAEIIHGRPVTRSHPCRNSANPIVGDDTLSTNLEVELRPKFRRHQGLLAPAYQSDELSALEQGVFESKQSVLEQLKLICGWLRSEIATTISRRQVPQLKFRWHTNVEGQK